jgi:DNA-binding FadR family transcriptional regulator
MDVDIRFHRAVTQAAGLPLLQEMLEVAIPVWMNMTSSVARERNQAVRLAAVVAEHAAVHDAIRASEPEAARYAMRRHLGNSRDRRIENDKQDG